ncbi:KH domain-containing protein [Rhodococcus sp. IEGM 1401]|jgi:spoIIIJ-associated protein|uniref:Jag family protein n=1 Tax=unclassified Rhodococcus (in: high G+C Gram-positive bacteria) TaxID=192944 RepID=UPI0022B448BC|nr:MULTISPECIES: R3H domain-containing nucleic acid-binding protein [unclassified Rhodococcus (in: high G+C Gram-positive bacteria)]MCZ4563216.1 KH domain-containing protein [Rhodococcus sp. IEGM 1401]MDI6626835.1 R3H domain-containing nucleic acid-binding protein [Rhodococcus sp. (in: high G+C Gram-positive bacteria)]MDI9923327.1 R3H domain-containing nucleic acid-binding protein [Rhodococcus sp. IEGM 1372]MDV8035815.1 R3H domain-containing nucleic acid-binding protein [Rhodococcus sp. IEGM 14
MAADVEEAQNDEVQTAGAVSGDGASDVVVEADQVSAVDVEADETPVVEKSEDSGVVENKTDDESDDDDEDDEDYLVEEGEIAGDYLEQLLDVLDFDGDIDLDVEGDRAIVSIDGGDDLAKLVGRKGEVLDALQELTRLAVQQSTGERSKLMLDVAGWRANRRTELGNLGAEAARRVLESGEREELTPMTPFERKIVHDAVAKIDGVASESTGVEPARRVVVVKA